MKRRIESLLLSVQSASCLRQERIYLIGDLVILHEIDLLRIPNIGMGAVNEIKTKLSKIGLSLGMTLSDTDDEFRKASITTALDLMKYMRLPQSLMDEYEENHQNNSINFFAIIELVIKNSFDARELKILKYRKDYWNQNKITLDKLGQELNLTKERIRQLEIQESGKLWSIIKDLSIYTSLINLKEQYGFDDNFIGNVTMINEQDRTHFSDNFLYKALAVFLKNDYQLVSKSSDRFLIKNNLFNVFDFNGFFDEFKNLIETTNIGYKLDFKEFVSPYFKQTNDDINSVEIESICENLLNLEFSVVRDIDNQILVKGKKKKPIPNYVEEVLEEVNLPMHLNDIYQKITENYPEFKQSKKYMVNIFVKNDKFIFFDRSSTYGLKLWEGELTQNSVLIDTVKSNRTKHQTSGIRVWSENGKTIVKGGTIIDIVIDYLKRFTEPKHIDDIYHEVQKWRDTTKSNLALHDKYHRYVWAL